MQPTSTAEHMDRIALGLKSYASRGAALESLAAIRADFEALESNYEAQDAALTAIYVDCGGKLGSGDTAANYDPEVVVRAVAAIRATVEEMDADLRDAASAAWALREQIAEMERQRDTHQNTLPQPWMRATADLMAQNAALIVEKDELVEALHWAEERNAELHAECKAHGRKIDTLEDALLPFAEYIGARISQHPLSAYPELMVLAGKVRFDVTREDWDAVAALEESVQAGEERCAQAIRDEAVEWEQLVRMWKEKADTLEGALRNLIDTAKSYRSDILGLHTDSLPTQMYFELRHLPARVDRCRVIAEAVAALEAAPPQSAEEKPRV